MRPATCKKYSICLHNDLQGTFGKLFVDWQQGDARRHSLDNQDNLRAYDCTCMYTNGDATMPRLGRLASDFLPSESVSRRCTHPPASGNHDVHVRSSPRRRDEALPPPSGCTYRACVATDGCANTRRTGYAPGGQFTNASADRLGRCARHMTSFCSCGTSCSPSTRRAATARRQRAEV
jgi:hypothetical protein